MARYGADRRVSFSVLGTIEPNRIQFDLNSIDLSVFITCVERNSAIVPLASSVFPLFFSFFPLCFFLLVACCRRAFSHSDAGVVSNRFLFHVRRPRDYCYSYGWLPYLVCQFPLTVSESFAVFIGISLLFPYFFWLTKYHWNVFVVCCYLLPDFFFGFLFDVFS